MLDVVVDGKVQQKAVKLGATYGIYTIIESGIDENDEIIVEGQNKVRVGQAVAPGRNHAQTLLRRRSRPFLCSMARQMLRNKEELWQISLLKRPIFAIVVALVITIAGALCIFLTADRPLSESHAAVYRRFYRTTLRIML